jgi:hypothetical protein
VRLSLDVQTAAYECSVAIIMFGAGAAVTWLGGTTPFSAVVGAATAALVSFVIHRAVPSPQARADAKAIADRDRRIAQLSDPQRKLDDLQAINRRSVKPFGPRGASRNW